MKAVRTLVLLLSSGFLPLAAAPASSLEEAYLESCRKDPAVPVPIQVVTPIVGAGYGGTSVKLEFTVDAKGRPAGFSIKSAPDDMLARVVVEAVKQWRFQPAERDGKPVAMKVALPVNIVDSVASGPRFAARE